jgi:outer membrane protein TolC
VHSARLVRDAAILDLQTNIDAALLDVRTTFYSVLLTREKVRVQEENIALFQGQLRDSRNQFHAGSVSNFEVLRARVSLANAQPDLITARNDYRVAIEQLRQSLGAPAASGLGAPPFPEVQGTLDYTPTTYDLDAALASAHEHRPELQRLDKLAEAGEESVTGARSTYYPNVGLYGGYEWGGIGLAQGGTFSGAGWLVGVQSSWAIFDGRLTAGKVIQAKSQLRQARLSRSQEDLAVDTEVRQALSAWEEARELVTASQQTVEEAVEALRLADSRFKAGSATQLDVLTSQVALTQARTNQIQANYNYLVAVAGMRKAMGLGDALVSD